MSVARYNKPKKSPIRVPRTPDDWHRLMISALSLAEKNGDPRATGIRLALSQGQTEQHLRKLGIICETDLQREFPTKT